ncbi:hypothetical protein [Humibacter ginsenosidimutans]|uniref:DUF3592 domain-containing protein n=1 Tax=Humibacter ginsenosidimutans TaxID=2599293 RepID=A0A5B8M507_9MICO|nr:hypothetical protein [Humibacter ginsenosidimutans]QDZ15014.1 hypothetical protein FPZ11_09760 [Humibacter ginsenosidimutans]
MPEGVNLLGTPQRMTENTDAARRRYAIGPFGQAWLWAIGIVLTVTSVYKAIAGPLLATALPTTKGVVLGWVTVPARTITYMPKIEYQVDGTTYRFVSGSTVTTLTDAPTTVSVSYVPFDPSTALWNTNPWWQSFSNVYLMVTLILGIILLCVAVYQWRIRGYWKPSSAGAGPSSRRLPIWLGIAGIVIGGAWLVSGYLAPASWYIPPDPNAAAAFILAIGVALLTSGLHRSRAGSAGTTGARSRATPAPE